jgi:hypothetical protein
MTNGRDQKQEKGWEVIATAWLGAEESWTKGIGSGTGAVHLKCGCIMLCWELLHLWMPGLHPPGILSELVYSGDPEISVFKSSSVTPAGIEAPGTGKRKEVFWHRIDSSEDGTGLSDERKYGWLLVWVNLEDSF